MKLVELLAKEIDKWPDGVVRICQSLVDSELYGDNSNGSCIFRMYPESAGNTPISEDSYDYVSRAQWQSERDRQKGGEWKRHRGGSQPVDNAVYVEVKLRCGDVQQSHAQDFLWQHKECDVSANIMQYRVISQPQAEEVEVNKFCTGEKCSATAENIAHSQQCQLEHEMAYTGFKIDQIDGPIKWRDTIIHCQAIIEDCEREIHRNENLLALEGFSLIPAMTPVMGVADIDMSDWRNWKAGDEVEVILDNDADLPVGSKYPIKEIESQDYAYGMPVCVSTGSGASDYQWPEDSEHKDRLVFKFVRRP